MSDDTCFPVFARGSELDRFCRVDRLGLTVTRVEVFPDRSILVCDVVADDQGCPGCGGPGRLRDSVVRRVTHVPFGRWPTMLEIRVPRYRCDRCSSVWRHDLHVVAAPRTVLSRDAVTWALRALVMDHMAVSRVAAGLGVSWNTVNTAVLALGREVLFDDPRRFDGVSVLGVDEHVWRHTRWGDKYVTVVIDLTPVRGRTGPARLLDMVEGRSKQVFQQWLASQTSHFRDTVEIVAMDGFTGYKTAATEELPDAVEVMDPFHVVALAGQALDQCRQRIQQETLDHRGHAGDPLYGIRRVLKTGASILTDRQCDRLTLVFSAEDHAPVEATWGVYQRIVAAYRDPDPARGRRALSIVIDTISRKVPTGLDEIARLGRTMKRRAHDILAYFDYPRTSNGPTEAINGRLEHLRGIALGFRNLTHYIARALLHSGGFRPLLHSQL